MKIIRKLPQLVNKPPIKILKFSVKDWLERGRLNPSRCDSCNQPGLYFLCDGETLLYIGMTGTNLRQRLNAHYPIRSFRSKPGGFWDRPLTSPVGKYIRQHEPKSLNWAVYLLPFNANREQIEAIEKKLIFELQPEINIRGKN